MGRHERNSKWLLLMLQGSLCAYCGKGLDYESATLDHYIPRAYGGPNAQHNLRLCCSPCNQSKGSVLPDEVAAEWKKYALPPLGQKLGDIC